MPRNSSHVSGKASRQVCSGEFSCCEQPRSLKLPQEPRDGGVFGIDAVDFHKVPAMSVAGRTVRPGQVGGNAPRSRGRHPRACKGCWHNRNKLRRCPASATPSPWRPSAPDTTGRCPPAGRTRPARPAPSGGGSARPRSRPIVPPPARKPGPRPKGNAAGEAVPRFRMGDNLVPRGKSYDLHTQISVIQAAEASFFPGIAESARPAAEDADVVFWQHNA